MGNMIDYVETYGNLTFCDKKFTIVDSLILSVLAYVKYEKIMPNSKESMNGLTLGEIGRQVTLNKWYSTLAFQEMAFQLFKITTKTKRYGTMKLYCYQEIYHPNMEIQFAAITFALSDGMIFVAYRGTDDSLVGWKEDFNMGYINPIPSQLIGVKYLEAVAAITTGKIRIGGHSKGGNIATYVAIHVKESVQERVIHVYSHDPPGFPTNIFKQDGYFRMEQRMHKVMPSSSIVGLLLQQNREYLIIKSNGVGLYQHDPFTWEVQEGKFIKAKSIGTKTKFIALLLNIWFFTMNDSSRERMVNHVYHKMNEMEFTSMDEVRRYYIAHIKHKSHIEGVNKKRSMKDEDK